MKAVILAGGRGSRLNPITLTIPKPLLPIGNKAIIEDIILKLKKHNFQEIIICTGYHAEYIMSYCGDGSKFGVRIDYFKENIPLGTAGPLRCIEEKVKNDQFILVMNGDIYTELDYTSLIDFHTQNLHKLTIAYKKHKQISAFGTLTIKDDRVVDIVEKPTYYCNINAGIYLLDPELISRIPKNKPFGMDQLIKKLLKNNIKLGSYLINEYWIGIENIDKFEEAMEVLNKVDGKEEGEFL